MSLSPVDLKTLHPDPWQKTRESLAPLAEEEVERYEWHEPEPLPPVEPMALPREERTAILRGPAPRRGFEEARGFAPPKFLTIVEAGKPGIQPCEPDVKVIDAREGILRGTCQTEEIYPARFAGFPKGYREQKILPQSVTLGRDSMQCIRNATVKRKPKALSDEIEIVLGCSNGVRNQCLTGSQTAALLNQDRDEVENTILRDMVPNQVLIHDPQSIINDLEAEERREVELPSGEVVSGITSQEREILKDAKEEVSNWKDPRWWFGEARFCLRKDLREKTYQDGGLPKPFHKR